MVDTAKHPAAPGTRVRLSGLVDSLTTRKMSGGYSLMGSIRLDTPFQGVSRLEVRLPMGSSLLAGDSAILDGVLLSAGPALLFDCASD